MPWPCRLIDVTDAERAYPGGTYTELINAATGLRPMVGDMWFSEYYRSEAHPNYLSPQYHREHAPVRAPLVVVLPGGRHFCIDSVYIYNDGRLDTKGWTVSGTPPNITMLPSINAVGVYHGYLRDGVISDDVEGHVYSPDGMRLLRP